MHPLLSIGTQAARNAAKVLVRSMEHLEAVDIKADNRSEFVSELERLALNEITETIHKAHPSHAILTTGQKDTATEISWLVDAINGAGNFLHGYPHFAISLSVKRNSRVDYAVIYDPLRDELFLAGRGDGARLNDRRLRVSQTKKLNESLLAFASQDTENPGPYFNLAQELLPQCQGIRHSGCVALDLAYLAAARLDGYWQASAREVETAAGLLLITEAGGMVSDFAGHTESISQGDIIAGNPKVHKEILNTIQQLGKQA